MKIAITSKGTDLSSEVDPRFGRAQYFIIYDTKSSQYQPLDNSINLNALQGAGIQSAKNIVDMGVEALITGNVGPKAFSTLQSAGIRVFIGAAGTVEDALQQFQSGTLQESTSSNVQGHWM